VPELAAVYRGAEEVRQFWREWLAAWETITFEYELIDAHWKAYRSQSDARERAAERRAASLGGRLGALNSAGLEAFPAMTAEGTG